MATMVFASGRAEDIYRTGPEVLAAHSTTIVTGTVSSYSKQILTTSQPPGPDAIPLTWVVTGRVDNPRVLKGKAEGPIGFSRNEHSVFVPSGRDREEWEEQYGDLGRDDQVVLFLSGDSQSPQIKALPSGTNERDLATIVRDITAIQAAAPSAQEAAWLEYLERSHTDEGRQAALRSLLRAGTDWSHLGPSLDRFSGNHNVGDAMREYSYGIVVFGLTEGRWADSAGPVGEYLCRQFTSASADDQIEDYLFKLRTTLRYATDPANQAALAPLVTEVGTCLRSRESSLKGSSGIVKLYGEIRKSYPGVL